MFLDANFSFLWKGLLPSPLGLGSRDHFSNDGARFGASPGGLSSAHTEGKASLNSCRLLGWAWAHNSLRSSSLGMVIASTRAPVSCLGFTRRLVCPGGLKSSLSPKLGEYVSTQEGNGAIK